MTVESIKHVADGISISATVAALAGWLPAGAAFCTIVWTLIRIYETRTVQGWIKRWKT